MLRIQRTKSFVAFTRMQNSNRYIHGNGCIGIVREYYDKWERRSPIAPLHVEKLTKEHGIRVLVQPSSRRAYADEEFAAAGAELVDDLSPASVLIGVKQVPIQNLFPNKTYLFFSHTIKGQDNNMPLLDAILDKNIRLIDYECVARNGSRLIAFGKYAGISGMIDTFYGLGRKLISIGLNTPFLNCPQSYTFPSLSEANDTITEIGHNIVKFGLPAELGPLVFVFTGNGNVSQGAQQIFKLLPHRMLHPSELPELIENFSKNPTKTHEVYGCVVEEDYMVRPNGHDFNAQLENFDKFDYFKNPQNYYSVFHKLIAPYMNVMVNCTYWDARYPRLLTINQMKELVDAKKSRLLVVGDISCDINGSVEFLKKSTTIDEPFFEYDTKTDSISKTGITEKYGSILMLGVDILPTELPRDSSAFFGDCLLPFLPSIATSTSNNPTLPAEIKDAIITDGGRLTKNFEYIDNLRKSKKKNKKVLVLGAGRVALPLIEYLGNYDDKERFDLTVVSASEQELKRVNECNGNSKIETLHVSIAQGEEEEKILENLISQSDVVVSLLPAVMHDGVARKCLNHGVNMVTASYVSPGMQQMHEEAKSKGVTFLNEMGLDPGMDHMAIMRIVDSVQARGGNITSLTSVCGGLASPDALVGNPLLYKFSWSPKGVLRAAQNSAQYRKNGSVIQVPGSNLLLSAVPYKDFPTFSLEVLPNRDSLLYADLYRVPNVESIFRGTLRYNGWSSIMHGFRTLGLFSNDTTSPNFSWKSFISQVVSSNSDSTLEESIYSYLNKLSSIDPVPVINALKWLGMLSSSSDEYLSSTPQPIIDVFCNLLERKLVFEDGERDLVLMYHKIDVSYPNDPNIERHTSALICFGDERHSAMSRTVGITCAIGAELVLQNLVQSKGVLTPMTSDIYQPCLEKLERVGLKFQESVEKL